MTQPKPGDLGLPRKFVSFRERQWEAIDDIVSAKERFIVQVQKTGAGKTLVGMGAAKYLNCRMMYLTATKGLQQQLLDDFEGMGLVSLMGKGNYQCSLDPSKTCAEGAVSKCLYTINGRSSMCTWAGAKQAVMDSQLAVTNYACWMAANKYGQGLGDYDMLICDEAHFINSALCTAQQIVITVNEVVSMLEFSWPEDPMEIDGWRKWAAKAQARAKYYLEGLKTKMDKSKHPSMTMVTDFNHFTHLSRKLADLVMCQKGKWIVDSHPHGYQFDPVLPHVAAERLLFHGIPKIVLTSGTIGPRTPGMMGIKQDNLLYREYVGMDDIEDDQSPFAYLPVISPDSHRAIQVDRNTTQEDLLCIVRKIDEIIECWGEYKGIIHTVSFMLRDFIISNSIYSRYMVTNYVGGEVTADVIRKFKKMAAPAILVSPSVTTGYDFPHSDSRFQIFPKVPFPDPRPKIEQARNGYDKDRYAYMTMQALVQGYGRGDRGDSDWCVSLVLDRHIQPFMWRSGHLAPTWFLPHYKQVSKIILPPLN